MVFRLPRRRLHTLIGLAVTAAWLVLSVPGHQTLPAASLERWLYDLRVRLTAPRNVDPRVVIVDIDERSLARIGAWPWGRDKLATLTRRLLHDYGAAVIGFDIILREPDPQRSGLALLDELKERWMRQDPYFSQIFRRMRPALDWDQRLARALRGGATLLAYHFNEQGLQTGTLPAPVALAEAGAADALPVLEPSGYAGSYGLFTRSARGGGYTNNLSVGRDGIQRRFPLLQRYQGELYQSLALAVVSTMHGNPPLRFVREDGALTALDLDGFRIAVDARARALIPYRGRRGSYLYVSAADVLEGKLEAGALRDKIVLLGSTAPTQGGVVATPMQTLFPRLEVQANLISGMLDAELRSLPPKVLLLELALLSLLGMVLAVLLPGCGPLRALGLGLALALLVSVLNLYLWAVRDMVVPLASSYLLIAILLVLHQTLDYAQERYLKLRLERRFGQYVPPELVERLRDERDLDFGVGGETRDMTVLFADLRGFTAIAESLPPQELTQFMHEWLTPMSEIIHRHQGTVDKYMGDCIMAFWGAPLPDPQHARHGLLAAVDMLAAIERLNREFTARDWPPLDLGVGLSSGETRVGDMGSRHRVTYTVLGDVVNLGSRLEALTQRYGLPLVVSAAVKAKVRDFAYLEVDRVRVKGKRAPVAIYHPLGLDAELAPALRTELAQYHAALTHYLRQDWNKAEQQLRFLQPGSRFAQLYGTYLERIEYYRAHDPGPGWDGVFNYSSK